MQLEQQETFEIKSPQLEVFGQVESKLPAPAKKRPFAAGFLAVMVLVSVFGIGGVQLKSRYRNVAEIYTSEVDKHGNSIQGDFTTLTDTAANLMRACQKVLGEADSLPPSERAAKAVLAVCRRLSDTGDMVFIENDAKLLLQRLPEDVKNVHYHDDETHIRQLLEKYDLVPNRGISLAAATVRGLILTVSHKEQIGELYPQVLETLVYGACRELFK